MNKKIVASFVLAAMLTTSAAKATNYGILVNTKKCNVTVYEEINNGWRALGTVKCCVGKDGKTPKGNFTIRSKESSFFHDDKEYKYVSYFSGKCAFHTVPCSNGRYDNSSLGHKRSGGCVRLAEAAAKWIYKYCKRGTKVIVK